MVEPDDLPRLDEDLVLMAQACAAAFGERVLADTRASAGDEVRFNDGYVFQHLVEGPRTVTQLAERLGVTQQAASKLVADLEHRGLVVRRADPDDGRARLVALSRRGGRAVEAARRSRREINDELVELLGPRRARSLTRALRDISDHTGALAFLASRRLRPEADR